SLMGSGTDDRINQVSVMATPVTNSVEAYNAYLQFLALPGSLQIAPEPPPPGTAHICRMYCNQYYWVPTAFAETFYRLALCTSVERGTLLVPPPKYYSVTLKKVLPPDEADQDQDPNLVIFKIDKLVPNDKLLGVLKFTDGSKVRVLYQKPKATPGGGKTKEITRLFQSDTILCQWDPKHP